MPSTNMNASTNTDDVATNRRKLDVKQELNRYAAQTQVRQALLYTDVAPPSNPAVRPDRRKELLEQADTAELETQRIGVCVSNFVNKVHAGSVGCRTLMCRENGTKPPCHQTYIDLDASLRDWATDTEAREDMVKTTRDTILKRALNKSVLQRLEPTSMTNAQLASCTVTSLREVSSKRDPTFLSDSAEIAAKWGKEWKEDGQDTSITKGSSARVANMERMAILIARMPTRPFAPDPRDYTQVHSAMIPMGLSQADLRRLSSQAESQAETQHQETLRRLTDKYGPNEAAAMLANGTETLEYRMVARMTGEERQEHETTKEARNEEYNRVLDERLNQVIPPLDGLSESAFDANGSLINIFQPSGEHLLSPEDGDEESDISVLFNPPPIMRWWKNKNPSATVTPYDGYSARPEEMSALYRLSQETQGPSV